ncbi:glutathione S-transferase family protein [Pseudoxanthobacter sp. M-2]|uniref:glutathione S-transferase family protein n=1 Tax=Pseudoxanthobacter sp. M-2 TaxID=3078754 RepID=UPI0038FBF5F9
MILIGQYDSPFVRRVGIALTLYRMPFEHRPWSVFGDADKIRPLNPLVRVPTLVLDDGEVVIETHAILDWLDSLAPPDAVLLPAGQPDRRRALKTITLATGIADKAVSLFYEKRLHEQVSDVWVERCRSQILGTLALLEQDRAVRPGAVWFGDRIGHADIAVAATLRFLGEAHPGLAPLAGYPALAADAARLEAMDEFRAISQPFIPPA